MSNNLKSIEYFLKLDLDVNQADKGGVTPLTQCIMNNSVEATELLLANGADIKLTPKNNQNSPFMYVVGNRNQKLFDLLCKSGVGVNHVDPQGDTPLHIVARGGWGWGGQNLDLKSQKTFAAMAKKLMEKGADANATNKQKQTPIEMAMASQNFQVVDVFVDKMESLPKALTEDRSMVHWASEIGLVNTVKKVLSKSNDDINKKNSEGKTALMLAAANGHLAIVKALITFKADVNIQDEYGETALLAACWNGHEKIVNQLLAAGANPKVVDETGQTALHLASWQGHLAVVETLLSKGLDVNAETASGSTPLHSASWKGADKVAGKLIAAGAKIENKDSDGETPLHKAAFQGNLEVVKVLLAKGADRNAKDAIGFTPLQKAEGQGKTEVVKLLKSGE